MLGLGFVIFLARLVDVSLNTLKFKEMIRGNKLKSSIIAFVEVIIYTLAAAKAYQYINNICILLFFSAGYACGGFLGMMLDEKLDNGEIFVLVIATHDEWVLADDLRAKGFGVTSAKGYGLEGAEKVQLKIIVEKKRMTELSNIVREFDSSAYIVTMDVRDVKSMEDIRK